MQGSEERLVTDRRLSKAGEPTLHRARRRAAVAVRGVVVVALLRPADQAVAAKRTTRGRLLGVVADEAVLDHARVAAVTGDGIGVVTVFTDRGDAVAAARRGAVAVAPVAVDQVAVVAFLAKGYVTV